MEFVITQFTEGRQKAVIVGNFRESYMSFAQGPVHLRP